MSLGRTANRKPYYVQGWQERIQSQGSYRHERCHQGYEFQLGLLRFYHPAKVKLCRKIKTGLENYNQIITSWGQKIANT